MREETRDDGKAQIPEQVVNPVEKNCMESRIGKDHLKAVFAAGSFSKTALKSRLISPHKPMDTYYTIKTLFALKMTHRDQSAIK